jgi:hypothetical protein
VQRKCHYKDINLSTLTFRKYTFDLNFGRGEESVHGLGRKARRKETTRKTKAQIGGWDQNGC